MNYYNKIVFKVVTTPEEFREWFTTEVAQYHEFLRAHSCAGCYVTLEKDWNSMPMPNHYPVLVQLLFDGGCRVRPTYVYQDQIMELLGLKGLTFDTHAFKTGVIWASHSDEYGPSGYTKLANPIPEPVLIPVKVEVEDSLPIGVIEDRAI